MIHIPTVFIVLYSICFVMSLVLFLIWEDSRGVTRWAKMARFLAKKIFREGVK